MLLFMNCIVEFLYSFTNYLCLIFVGVSLFLANLFSFFFSLIHYGYIKINNKDSKCDYVRFIILTNLFAILYIIIYVVMFYNI